MPDSTRQPHGDRYAGLRDLQRRPRRASSAPARDDGPERSTGDAAGGDAADRLRNLRLPGRRGHGKRHFLVVVNVVVALALVSGVAAFAYAEYRLNQVHRLALPGLEAAKGGPFTVLIVGSDTRSLGSGASSQFGSASQVAGQRSDTIMLARVVPAKRTLTLMSIPRDLWVPIKGMGYSKINSAFNTGPELLITTIESDLHIPINHFIEVNFDSFRAITDAVGGVKFWFPTPAKDYFSGLYVPKAGCVNLTGNQALGFVRSRHYEYYANGQWNFQGLSDLARIQRQQVYVKKMIKKAETKFTDPLALNDIIGSVAKNLTVDKGFGASLMIGLAEDFRTADVAGIPTETLPVNNYYVDGEDALSLQQPQADQMIHAFNTLGTPAQAVAAHTSTAPSTAHTSTTHTSSPPKQVVPSQVAVEVANGSGVNQQAAVAASAVGTLGFKTTVTATSPGFDHTANEIRYAPDSLAAARYLATRLAGGATLVESSALTPTPYNLELITGHQWAGLGHGTARVQAHAAASPGSQHVSWVLPGPEPTAAELASC